MYTGTVTYGTSYVPNIDVTQWKPHQPHPALMKCFLTLTFLTLIYLNVESTPHCKYNFVGCIYLYYPQNQGYIQWV